MEFKRTLAKCFDTNETNERESKATKKKHSFPSEFNKKDGSLHLAPNLGFTLRPALGALAGRFDRKLVVALVIQRDLAAIRVVELEHDRRRRRLKLGRHTLPKVGEAQSGVECHPRRVPIAVDRIFVSSYIMSSHSPKPYPSSSSSYTLCTTSAPRTASPERARAGRRASGRTLGQAGRRGRASGIIPCCLIGCVVIVRRWNHEW